jgi:hypothetical protein
MYLKPKERKHGVITTAVFRSFYKLSCEMYWTRTSDPRPVKAVL